MVGIAAGRVQVTAAKVVVLVVMVMVVVKVVDKDEPTLGLGRAGSELTR